MKVLITGFDPFGGEKTNPAYDAVQMMASPKGVELIKLEIPTVFNRSAQVLQAHIEKHQPDVVICVGQAGGRSHMTIERVAINLDDARIPDNDGQSPVDEWIQADGPAAYFSNLPIKAMIHEIRQAGIPASLSNSAGTYVCNHIMYQLMHMIHTQYPQMRGGFIHVPFSEEQVCDRNNVPSMHLKRIAQGLEIAVKTAASVTDDIKVTEGTTC